VFPLGSIIILKLVIANSIKDLVIFFRDDGICCSTTQKREEMAGVGAIERNASGFQRLLGDVLGITGIKSKTHATQMPLLLLSIAFTYDDLARLFASTLTRNLYR
jgi:hypothetical protein